MPHVDYSLRIQSAHGFVQDQQFRIGDNGLSNTEPLEHSFRKTFYSFVGCGSHGSVLKHFIYAPVQYASRKIREDAPEFKYFSGCKIRIEIWHFREVS